MMSMWRRYKRVPYVFAVGALIIGTYIPLFSSQVSALTGVQLEPRSIQMSDSSPSGNATITTGVGSGTNVSYKVTISNVNPLNSLAINFCDNSPIIGDTCLDTTGFPGETSPGSMSVSSATLGSGADVPTTTCTGGAGNTVGGTGWTMSAPNPYTIFLSSGGANTVCGGTVGSPATQTFTIKNVTNPIFAESYYARIYTYNSNAPTSAAPTVYSAAATPGSFLDYGGIALSTVAVITITAKVQESLSFCVTSAIYTTWTTTGDCSDPNVASHSPSATLGTVVGTNVVLAPQVKATATDTFQLSTNATGGAIINLHSSNTCGGLSVNGGTDLCPIKAIGDFAGAGGQTNTYDLNTAQTNDVAVFGAQLGTAASGTAIGSGLTGTGTLNRIAPYNGTGTLFGMNDTALTGVVGTYGNQIANTTAPCYLLTDTLTFGATSALTTPAGIYTTNISLIATGSF
jgi:hypothetical protein